MAHLIGRLFQRGDAHAGQFGPFQFVKAQQADIAAPLDTQSTHGARYLQGQGTVGGNHRFAHAAMASIEVAEHPFQQLDVVQRNFGLFGQQTGMLRHGLVKRVQPLQAGIDRANGLAEKQNGFETLLQQVFRGGRRGLVVVEAHHIAGEIMNFSVDQYHRQHGLLQRR
ncbi:hypothetical protein D3C72_1181260 [compost metagenome]